MVLGWQGTRTSGASRDDVVLMHGERSRRHVLRGGAALSILALTGCGFVNPPPEPDLPIEPGVELDNFLIDIRDTMSAAPISDVTNFEWEDFRIFSYGTDAAIVNEAAGLTVITKERMTYENQLFLFRVAGTGVYAIISSFNGFAQPYEDIYFGRATIADNSTGSRFGFVDPEA